MNSRGNPESPLNLARAYDMSSSVCRRRELVVVPTSRGRCDTYKEEFPTPSSFADFVSEARDLLNAPSTPLHLSAHSGAGKVLRSVLTEETSALSVSSVSVFDAFYHPDDARLLLAWALRFPGRNLRSVVLSEGVPRLHAHRELGFTPGRELRNGSRLQSLRLGVGHDHWSIVRSQWLGE